MQAVPRQAFSYRSDPAVPAFADDRPVIIFDGKCVLCSRFAQFIIRHDHGRQFRMLAAQTPLGDALYKHYGLATDDYETNLLIEDGRAWLKSEGTIRMLARLGFPWSLAVIGKLVPRAVRDRLYDVMARRRLRWFGVRQTCYLPDPAEADRFLA
jgi:predicted DCC family thiol-disulfide oxidoreductase YuxK